MIDRRRDVVSARDGWRLDVLVLTPPEPSAVAVVGHAMMVDRRTIARDGGQPCLATTLAESGIAVLAPDLRGHGASGPRAADGGRWSYDDLVALDAPALFAHARAAFPGLPLHAVGHSLFGHVALAHEARAPGSVERIALLAGNVWARRWEPNALRWLRKRAIIEASAGVVRAVGYLPARRVRVGTADEAGDYWRQVVACVRGDDWLDATGRSYAADLPRVRAPVLSLVSAADTLYCHPDCARLFLADVPDARTEEVERDLGLAHAPGHMGLVTDGRSTAVWRRVARFLRDGE